VPRHSSSIHIRLAYALSSVFLFLFGGVLWVQSEGIFGRKSFYESGIRFPPKYSVPTPQLNKIKKRCQGRKREEVAGGCGAGRFKIFIAIHPSTITLPLIYRHHHVSFLITSTRSSYQSHVLTPANSPSASNRTELQHRRMCTCKYWMPFQHIRW